MGAQSVDIARFMLVFVLVLGYAPIVISYRRYGIKWLFSAYTVLVGGAVLLLIGGNIGFRGAWIVPPFTVAVSAILFFLSAYKSREEIESIEKRIEESSIPLE